MSPLIARAENICGRETVKKRRDVANGVSLCSTDRQLKGDGLEWGKVASCVRSTDGKGKNQSTENASEGSDSDPTGRATRIVSGSANEGRIGWIGRISPS